MTDDMLSRSNHVTTGWHSRHAYLGQFVAIVLCRLTLNHDAAARLASRPLALSTPGYLKLADQAARGQKRAQAQITMTGQSQSRQALLLSEVLVVAQSTSPIPLKIGMSCPSWQRHRTGYRWSPVQTLPVARLRCDVGCCSRTVVVIKLRRTSDLLESCLN